jgi:hypothetical protein
LYEESILEIFVTLDSRLLLLTCGHEVVGQSGLNLGGILLLVTLVLEFVAVQQFAFINLVFCPGLLLIKIAHRSVEEGDFENIEILFPTVEPD